MPLGAPAIIGPVSTCSTSVRVMGQFTGSRVRIFVDGQVAPIGDMVVSWSDAFVGIDRSRLVAGARLVATQRLDGETSLPSPQGQTVEEARNGPVTLPFRIFACAQSIYVTNCCPGAQLEVVQNGNVLGTATAVSDQAWIDFVPNRRIAAGSPVQIRQIICTSPTPVTTTSAMPAQAPTVDRNRLASPVIIEPLEECQRVVPLTGVIEGARVKLVRRGTSIFEAPVPVPSVDVMVQKLATGEEFEVTQSMPRCEFVAHEPFKATVKALTSLARPRIDGPVCKGPHQVIVSRLKPGATLRLFDGNTELGRWEVPLHSMPVDMNVPGPTTITAQQELCNIVSDRSRPYTVATARSGRWFVVEDEKGEDQKARSFAIHVGLVRTGHIVMFSGDQHSRVQQEADPQDIDHCELIDCSNLTVRKIDAPDTDVFCSGHAFLPDGRLLVAGGTEKWVGSGGGHDQHFPGLPDAWLFDPIPDGAGKHWRRARKMAAGRWYPTLVTLADGRVLALSGHPSEADARHNNNTMEVFTGNSWQNLGDSPDIITAESAYLYPRVFVDPPGGLFSATAIERGAGEPLQVPTQSAAWSPGGVAWKRTSPPISGAGWGGYESFYRPGALLPLVEDEDRQRSFRFQIVRAGDDAPWITDLGTPDAPIATPRWASMGGGHPQRVNSSMVLLPSGEVLLCGGVGNAEDDSTAVLAPEMLVPDGSDWRWDAQAFASAKFARNYHSTALLMPDGRVFVAGSNINAQQGVESANLRRLEIEIYEPWYVCRPRPRIIAAPGSVRSGERLLAHVRSQERITRLVLMRAGSATHGFDSDQRCVTMIARAIGSSGEFAGVVPRPSVAVPGVYLLFAVTEKGVPSHGVFVTVVRPQ